MGERDLLSIDSYLFSNAKKCVNRHTINEMGSKINTGIHWSLSELRALVDNKNSCVYFERAKRHIALHPFHLNDLNKALHEILSSSINFYDFELKGLLLSYKNPKILTSLGSILYDSHFIHIDVEADFYLFKPDVGCILSGIVNKQATKHVGVLVHKAFNVSILINENAVRQNHCIEVGQEVKFTVIHVDFKGRLPFIKGELLSDTTLTNDKDFKPDSNPLKEDRESVNGEHSENNDDTSMKQKKSSNRVSFLTSILNQSSDSSSEEDVGETKKPLTQKEEKTVMEHIKNNKNKTHHAIPSKIITSQKCNVKVDDSYSSVDQFNIDRDLKIKKQNKKKFKISSQEEAANHNNIENTNISPTRRSEDEICERILENDDTSIDFVPFKKPKIRTIEENIIRSVKIKRESTIRDVESLSNDEFVPKQQNNMMNENKFITQFRVKREPVVKTEVKNKAMKKKRKHKETNKDDMEIKCELDTTDSKAIISQRKKMKTLFNE